MPLTRAFFSWSSKGRCLSISRSCLKECEKRAFFPKDREIRSLSITKSCSGNREGCSGHDKIKEKKHGKCEAHLCGEEGTFRGQGEGTEGGDRKLSRD